MKYSILTITIVLSLFLITQFVGLTANSIYAESELPYRLQPPSVEPKFSPWFFLSMVIVISLLFFAMKRFKLEILMKLWFFIAITICIAVTLSAFVDSWIAVIVALSIVLLKFKERDIYMHNLGEILMYGGVVALFAPMLNFWAVVILLIGMSIYDYIAVFVTKHMIGLAKMQEELGIFSGLVVVNKDDVAILGGGDIAFTLLFAVIVLRQFGIVNALLSIYGATLFIAILMIIGKRKNIIQQCPLLQQVHCLDF